MLIWYKYLNRLPEQLEVEFKIRIEAIKLKRKEKRVVRERYLSERILNFLIETKMFSIKILCLEMKRFSAF